jgi:hypothetical protein
MEMIIQPSHDILDSNMHVPECIDLWNLYSPPDGGFDALETDLELIYLIEFLFH